MNLNSIRTKLFAAFFFSILLALITGVLYYSSAIKVDLYNQMDKDVNTSIHLIHKVRQHIDDFMLEEVRSPTFYESHLSTNIQQSYYLIDSAAMLLFSLGQSSVGQQASIASQLQLLQGALKEYKKKANMLVQKQLQRGFKDWGAEGEFRKRIHDLEAIPQANKEMILMLRRYEKDFLLRGGNEYVLKFENTFKAAVSELKRRFNSHFDEAFTEEVLKESLAKLLAYKYGFELVVKLERELGNSEGKGIRRDLREMNAAILEKVIILQQGVEKETDKAVEIIEYLFIAVVILQVFLGGWIGVVFANGLSKRIFSLAREIRTLADGRYITHYGKVDVSDELSEAVAHIHTLNERMKAVAAFAKQIGDGDVYVRYNKQYREGELEEDLRKMRDKLRKVKEEENTRKWITDGVVRFGDILTEGSALEQMGNKLISGLAQYIKANQGAMYMVVERNGETYYELVAAFAFEKRKYISQKIDLNEGLLGQVYREKRTYLLNNIPEGYVHITSGLGMATPNYLIMVPLIADGGVCGLLEFASFHPFESHHVQLLEQLAESVANVLRTVKINEKSQEVARSLQEQAVALMRKDQELEDQVKVLEYVQKEMKRNEEHYLSRIQELEKTLESLAQ
ncbi:GAF domain-containing protein [Limibacter armeniacum]|uniref:GAF domain-containing protein n=1 Tax=Limibacter armeniacum TaxID=466084 RepID=UPI002FE61E7A